MSNFTAGVVRYQLAEQVTICVRHQLTEICQESAVGSHLLSILERHLGKGVAERNGKVGFKAEGKNRIAAFAHQTLGLNSVQIEMKPSVRVPLRRIDSSMYQKNSSKYGGPYSALPQNVLGMMQSLVEFIEYVKAYKE
jgi:hypothetical protein